MQGNPIQRGINHRVMPFGVHWMALLGVLFVAVVLASFVKLWLGIAWFFLVIWIARWINKQERRPIRAARFWWKWGRHAYDAGRRSQWRSAK